MIKEFDTMKSLYDNLKNEMSTKTKTQIISLESENEDLKTQLA